MRSKELERALSEWWEQLEEAIRVTCDGRVEFSQPVYVANASGYIPSTLEITAVSVDDDGNIVLYMGGNEYGLDDLYAEDALILLKALEEACWD